MKWWCSASDAAWEWHWRPYPGVWLFLLLLFWIYRRAWRNASGPDLVRRPIAYGLGMAALWVAVDWPLGPLGAGYLLSAHTISFILLSLVAPPLLLLGLPRGALTLEQGRFQTHLLRFLAAPLPALVLFNGILALTHLPDFVDGWMRSQGGAFGTDMTWLLGGLILWWPVFAPRPAIGRLSEPAQMGYLFVASILPTVPAMMLVFADYPLYGLYELSPRVFDILNAHNDQQLAGLLMKVIGDIPLWAGFGAVFFRWQRHETGSTPPAPSQTDRWV
ncbi:MAG TPA: cytochrome c oxidase assembly protein, partial [Gemmatimonadales bacterium]|nr:cytochrome c oxidase assembly protein [Gemmatimonadales bacterium]